ncbi:B12-binding domain-containing radical SAM protein [Opitutus terrae]|uniref:Radical SAM domain protein n=1 Tax=Opitutus terrae (strain DSM 11246 / JCM 15787 / PB90-1) TaxID=452637 RepID=B1ZRJ1_OPITP|nr:B12-binding domain-containing radical SAM protein [Opitutus terrae]ACB77641.1 Radical SAM domain protein [Opitutus terrae PB90-1]
MPPQHGLLAGFAAGLSSIADFLRARLPDTKVELVDLSEEPITTLKSAILSRGLPIHFETIVGITTTTASYQAALSVAAAFKELGRAAGTNVTTILGGHHASADAEIVLRNHTAVVDFVIAGEGETAMLEFLQRFPGVAGTPGLICIREGRVQRNPPPLLLSQAQLDTLPPTAPTSGTNVTGKFGHITYISARGCPLGCAFCAVGNQRIRAKSVAKVAADVRLLVAQGHTRIAIEDNFFAHTPQRTEELCGALAELRSEGLGFTWDCQTRVESMDRKGLPELLSRAGCEAVYLGVESLNPDQLRYLNKTPNPERYLNRLRHRVIPALLASRVGCYLNLQFGLPGENDDHHSQTLATLRAIGQMAHDSGRIITIFPQLHVLYPGTVHFLDGLRADHYPADIFELFTAWEIVQSPVLKWLGRHFAHGTGGIPVGILNPESLRRGSFTGGSLNIIDPNAVTRIDATLSDLSQLAGIDVFRYGRHLVPGENDPPSDRTPQQSALAC